MFRWPWRGYLEVDTDRNPPAPPGGKGLSDDERQGAGGNRRRGCSAPDQAVQLPGALLQPHGAQGKRALGDFFGLKNFGVNLTRIAPGGESALMHTHSKQDEMVYVLEGEAVLATPSGETRLGPGDCAGFPARGEAHHILNRTDRDLLILEIGDRPEGDEGSYPKDDIQAVMGADGKWRFARKDGTPY